jgi:hypothetical protein
MKHDCLSAACLVLIFFGGGCAGRQFTFRVVDAETGKPLKGISVAQRNLHTATPTDQEHVIWFYDTWHPVPTKEDGLFTCWLEKDNWHVLEFSDEGCDGPKATDHRIQYATISPVQTYVLVGDWPKEGDKFAPESVITVKLETYAQFWAWLNSPSNPGNRPSTEPSVTDTTRVE